MRILTALAFAMLAMGPAAQAMSLQHGTGYSGGAAPTTAPTATTAATATQTPDTVTVRGTIEALNATHQQFTLYHQPVHYSGSGTQVFKDNRRVDTSALEAGQHIRALVRKANGVSEAEIIWINPR